MREEVVDGLPVNAEHATHPDRVEPAVVDQAADRLRMDAELVRNLPNTDQPWFSIYGRHNPREDSQVPQSAATNQKPGLVGLARLAAKG